MKIKLPILSLFFLLMISAINANKSDVIKSIEKTKWDSSLKNIKNFEYQENFYESKEMHDLLVSFYKYGFVLVKKTPRDKNFLINFANSIGVVRPTNWGVYFTVKSLPNANDLAYTSLPLKAHTDNPYRKPVPCVQLLHCIENEVKGGLSTITDGFAVANGYASITPINFEMTNMDYIDELKRVNNK